MNAHDEELNAYKAIFVNGHPKGSLMVRMSNVEIRQDGIDNQVQELKESFDNLAKKILTWLLIAGAVISLLQFLGPSIRKSVGMNESSIPATVARSER